MTGRSPAGEDVAMRAVVQRVSRASVTVDGEVVGAIEGPGLVVLLGVTHDEAVVFSGLDLEIWGRPHRDYGDMIPFERLRPRSTRWQVAVGHGHYVPVPDRTIRLRPSWLIGDDELAATGSDYIALGHWNRAVKVGNVAAYYSGVNPRHHRDPTP